MNFYNGHIHVDVDIRWDKASGTPLVFDETWKVGLSLS